MVSVVSLLLVLVFWSGPALSQQGDTRPFEMPRSGFQVFGIWDGLTTGGTQRDSIDYIQIGEHTRFGLFIKYLGADDSTNMRIYADISSDGDIWFSSILLDQQIASGAIDLKVAKEVLFPKWVGVARCRIENAANSDDSTTVSVDWVVHYPR